MTSKPHDKSMKTENSFDNQDSSQGIDYGQLRNLLSLGLWKEADQETRDIMLKISSRDEVGWLRSKDIEKFPCKDLHTIDQLWTKYSNGRFGFSVQKRIWHDLGSSPSQTLLGERLGWYLKDTKQWLFGPNLNFTLMAPEGHLPRLGVWWIALFARIKACGLLC